jgi:hypothetical protein
VACTGDGSTGSIKTQQWLFQNWARTQQTPVPVVYNPETKKVHQIVNAVREVENAGGTLKAIGSQWSYSGVAVDSTTQAVINTGHLTSILSNVIPFALLTNPPKAAKYYVHVEAGIKLWDLNCRLDGLGLALPTLGGSNGQSLAGVISTGSHGSDIDAPPVADAVCAIHLVGPGGQEWWIERDQGDRAITDPALMLQLKQNDVLCRDMRVEYDTSLFRAVLVSMGRIGVIYSYVLQATDKFALTLARASSTWTVERSNLRATGTPYSPSRWVEIFLNPYPDSTGEHQCRVSRLKTGGGPPFAPDPTPGTFDAAFDGMCRTPEILPVLAGALAALPAAQATATAAAAPTLGPLLAIPVAGPILYAAAITAIQAPFVAAEVAVNNLMLETAGDNFGELLAVVVNHLVDAGLKDLIPAIVSAMANSLRPLAEDGQVKESFRAYTRQPMCGTVPREGTNCERQMDGLEIAFDMSPGKTDLFDFIADVLAAADKMWADNDPAAFGMSLRLTGKTTALLGMQQFARTCSVELFALRGVRSTPALLTKLFELGEKHHGIPHWGLINELTATQVRSHYPGLSEWRQALRLIIDGGVGREETFRSAFSQARGLEPEQYMPPVVDVPIDQNGETFPYDFGTVRLHNRKSVTFHFANTGQHELRVTAHDVDPGGGFELDDVPPSLSFGVPGRPHEFELDDVAPVAQPNHEIRVKATFVAERIGSHQGKLKIYTNAANLNPIVIPLHAWVEAFSLVPVQPSRWGTLDLGEVAIGATQATTVTVMNDGTLPAELTSFEVSNPAVGQQIAVQTGGIGAGRTRSYAVEYTPTVVGHLDTDLVLHFTDGATPPRDAQDVRIQVTGVGFGAQVRFTPGVVDFGSVAVGEESRLEMITIENVGRQALTISSVFAGGPEFHLADPAPTVIGPEQSQSLGLVFAPRGVVGARQSSFTVTSNSLAEPTAVTLTGVGLAVPILRATPGAAAFADTIVGSSRLMTIEVANPGAVGVAVGSVTLSPTAGDFRIVRDTSSGATIAMGQSRQIDVEFAPRTSGTMSAALEITGPAQPLQVALSGVAIAASGLVPSRSDVDFGPVGVGATSRDARLTFQNLAATPATITAVNVVGAAAGDVVVATDCTGAVLAPGATCNVDLRFRPTTVGPRTATLDATASVAAYEVTLHAVGLGADAMWTQASLDFGATKVGVQTPAQTVGLINQGNAPLAITLVDTSGDAADFPLVDMTPGIVTLPPNAEKAFQVRFKATAVGNRQASLRVHAGPQIYTVTFIGVGRT